MQSQMSITQQFQGSINKMKNWLSQGGNNFMSEAI